MVSSHTGQNSHHEKNLQTIKAGEDVKKKGNPLTMLAGIQIVHFSSDP